MPSNSPPYSYARYVSTGSAGPYAINFDYLASEHLTVSINGVAQATSAYTLDTNANTVTFDSAPGAGQVVLISRTTPKGKSGFQNDVADFSDGSVLTAADLDQATLGLLYVAQEADDGGTTNALNKDQTDEKFDATDSIIKNVLSPTEASEVANKGYVDGLSLYNSPTPLSVYTFTGNNSLTAFTMSPAPPSNDPKAFIVDIGGVTQKPTTDYTVQNGVITFGTAPVADTITVRNIGVARDTLAQPIISETASGNALEVKAINSQSGDLQQWQNTSGTALAKVAVDGDATFVDVTATGNLSVTGNITSPTITSPTITGTATLNNAAQINATLTTTGLATLSGGVAAGTANITTTSGNITSTSGHLYVPGCVVQVQCFSTKNTHTQTIPADVHTTLTDGTDDIAVTITPKSTSSKIIIDVHLSADILGHDHTVSLKRSNATSGTTTALHQDNQNNYNTGLSVLSDMYGGTANNASTASSTCFKYFDDAWSAGSAEALTYIVTLRPDASSSVALNGHSGNNTGDRERLYTIITATEIAG